MSVQQWSRILISRCFTNIKDHKFSKYIIECSTSSRIESSATSGTALSTQLRAAQLNNESTMDVGDRAIIFLPTWVELMCD